MATPTPAERHKARHYAMQGLYQWQMSKLAPSKIVQQFREEYDMTHVDVPYFSELLNNVPERLDVLDKAFQSYVQERSLEEIDPITLVLLRIACYEFIYRIDIPYRVVIKEAVSLAKKFGATDSHKFINGVLDRAAKQHRPLEAGQ